MTAKEKRAKVKKALLSRVGKNTYTQGANRTQVGSGYGDCSATSRWAYLSTHKIDIGINTEAQLKSSKSKKVDVKITNGIPQKSKLRVGDLFYFRGTNDSRYQGVGHVEVYIGNGKLCGHGSGKGPTIKDMEAYCKYRQNAKSTSKLKNQGLIEVKRVFFDD
jgi:cell wall-associated NlpC family hydrolase